MLDNKLKIDYTNTGRRIAKLTGEKTMKATIETKSKYSGFIKEAAKITDNFQDFCSIINSIPALKAGYGSNHAWVRKYSMYEAPRLAIILDK